jgi:hypothetical protein
MATALLQSIDFKLHERPAPELLPAGIPSFDAAFGGIPRGCVTDVFGPASSGRTSLMLALVAQATAHEEFCAVVDAGDAFDPASAAAAGVALERLLWIRCGGNAEHALKATDLLLQAGGFGLVAMDLGDIALKSPGAFRWLRGTGCGARWRTLRRRWWLLSARRTRGPAPLWRSNARATGFSGRARPAAHSFCAAWRSRPSGASRYARQARCSKHTR